MFEVIVNVDLAVKDQTTVARFEEQVAGYPEVVEFRSHLTMKTIKYDP
jgi:hypothetical protein